jgi:hypothetical protein
MAIGRLPKGVISELRPAYFGEYDQPETVADPSRLPALEADRRPQIVSSRFEDFYDVSNSHLICLISSGHFNLGERPRLLRLNNNTAA